MNEKETVRLLTLSERDRVFWEQGLVVAGMDEVGRGPLAGPVVAGCAVMPSEPLIPYVNDSKKLSENRRETVGKAIRETALATSCAWVWPETIDSINILNATKRAFNEAFAAIGIPVDEVLIDALEGLDIPARQHAIIHGDALSYSIACASILAKTERDAYMIRMDETYPQYGFRRNKGYGTREHIEALQKYGPCPIHRRSFLTKLL